MHLAVIVNRHPERAREVLLGAGVDDPLFVETPEALADAIALRRPAYTRDPEVATRCAAVDVVIESTGAIEYGARVALDAITHGRHLVMLNAELDATAGPILNAIAQEHGVVYTGCEGDQPGVQMNLLRFVEGIGCRPLLVGNIKGMLDRYRTPATQAAFAEQWRSTPEMVTNFADGTKVNMEQAVVANATGMTVGQRGMWMPEFSGHVDDGTGLFDFEEIERLGGVVDSVVGASPGPGVFVYATHDDPDQRWYLEYLKMGPGPIYCFYVPYHLCHFEVPTSAARAVLFADATVAPLGGPVVEVVAVAKRDLTAGEVLDGIGGYCTYGLAERADVTAGERLLPMGVAEGCRVLRAMDRDTPLTYDDVEIPPGRLIDALRAQQADRWG